MSDALLQIAQDVGYTKGKVDALVVDNTAAHNEIKGTLEKTAENVLATKTDLVSVHTELALHAANIVKLTERVDDVEKKQTYITGLAKFITDHPKLVVGLIVIVAAAATGLSISEVRELLGG